MMVCDTPSRLMAMMINSTDENVALASFTVVFKSGDLKSKVVPITLNNPFSKVTVSLNED